MKKKNNKGFSLIELIIAIAILVILTGLLAPQFMRYMEKSREAKDMQALDTVYGAVQTALANEDAYKNVQDKDSILTELQGQGMKFSDIVASATATATDTTKAIPFTKEVYAITGGDIAWTSKAVTEAGGNEAVFVAVDKDLKVTVWIGKQNAKLGVMAYANTDVLNADASIKLGEKEVKTAGTKFYISK
ncbi:MAG: prepilin-type N-terminal cleavage/methylation domain-containing protein [Clostridium sp.]